MQHQLLHKGNNLSIRPDVFLLGWFVFSMLFVEGSGIPHQRQFPLKDDIFFLKNGANYVCGVTEE